MGLICLHFTVSRACALYEFARCVFFFVIYKHLGQEALSKKTRASNFVLLDLFGPALQPQKNFRLPVLGVNAMRRLVRIRSYTSNSFHRKQELLLNY
jgi:hypothetical protein